MLLSMVSALRHCALCLLLIGPFAAAADQRIELSAEQAVLPLGRAEAIEASLRWPDDGELPELTLGIGRLDASELGYVFRQVRWRCRLEQVEGEIACRGPASAQGLRQGELMLRLQDDRFAARLTRGTASSAADYRFETARLDLQAQRLPLEWLLPLQQWLWEEAQVQGGQVSGNLGLDLSRQEAVGLSGRVELAGLDLDTPDGRIATAGLGLRLDLSGRFGEQDWSFAGKGPVLGGELLVGPLYASLPERGIELDLALRSAPRGGIELQRLRWNDAGVIALQAEALIDAEAEDPLPRLRLQAQMDDLGMVKQRYADALLGTLGLGGLEIDGRAALSLEREAGDWQRLLLDGVELTARDAAGRFALQELDGSLGWHRGSSVEESRLAWKQVELYGLQLGAAAARLSSSDGGMSLAAPLSIPAFDGRLALDRLRWMPGSSGEGPSLDLAITLQDLDLAKLSTALKWPPFTGRLSGSLPQAHYAGGTLTLDGGLRMDLFGGSVDIGQLILERPFGVAPTLSADVRFANIDLQPLTTVFGFGEITGRLEGHIRGLRLLDWSPVAFDAELRTAKNAPGPRRISQRAVRDLSSVGGGGLAGGIQASFLRAFETFGYARIGLSCRLERNVCHMGGLDSSGQGYTIVEGSGLPRISVVGFQRRVDWPVLMDRLKATAQGQLPTFD